VTLPCFVCQCCLKLTVSAHQDYYATKYSAEIVNTLTNLLFMLLGVKGILSCRRNGHDAIFEVAYYGYLLVGTGSFLFHSTLKCKLYILRFVATES
jgi:dihydroceramidase